jgi:hypothetical protein
MESYSFEQLLILASVREKDFLSANFSQPTSGIQRLISYLEKELVDTGVTVETNRLTGTNCVVNLPRRIAGVTKFSIMYPSYGGYELALLNEKSVVYIDSIGFSSSLPIVYTLDDVVDLIRTTIQKLQALQKEYNKKRHNRRKARHASQGAH